MHGLLRLLFSRAIILIVLILAQITLLVLAVVRLNEDFVYFYLICQLLSVAAVLFIINNRTNPAYKISWIITILLFPIFGVLFYLIFGYEKVNSKFRKKVAAMDDKLATILPRSGDVSAMLAKVNPHAACQSHYISETAGFPLYNDSATEYLPTGEKYFDRLLEKLEKAERFIFIEMFVIRRGRMWDTVLEILTRKVEQGLDVRVIYDDMGCLTTLPGGYWKKLEQMGIRCAVFNPIRPVLSLRINSRDHRKICVIDGHTAFTGGINFGDEYINVFERFGHWKDSAIMLEGNAAFSFTAMFLAMWEFCRGITEDYDCFRPREAGSYCGGYVQPYGDNPLNREIIGETVYMNMINRAERCLYITTPYLIMDNEMVTALGNAAKNGVDVRIITPHIADKRTVNALTRAYYAPLVESGVKIYEYTPGFVHSKIFVADDEYAVVGTINLDYRSLFLHFECAVWLYSSASVSDVRDDFLQTLELCCEISLEQIRKTRWYKKLWRAVLRVFAPMM